MFIQSRFVICEIFWWFNDDDQCWQKLIKVIDVHIYLLGSLMMQSIRLIRDIIKIFFIFFDEIIRSIFLSEILFDKTFDKNLNDDDEKDFINDDRKNDNWRSFNILTSFCEFFVELFIMSTKIFNVNFLNVTQITLYFFIVFFAACCFCLSIFLLIVSMIYC